MEEVQRNDRKLREAAEKRRKDGGPKIVYRYREENSSLKKSDKRKREI